MNPKRIQAEPWFARRLEGLKREMCGLFAGGGGPIFKSKDIDGLRRIANAHNESISPPKQSPDNRKEHR